MENNKSKQFIYSVLSFLCWIGPFFGYGIFFPIGVLLLYKTNHRLRAAAFQSIIIQIIIYSVIFPIEVLSFYKEEYSQAFTYFLFTNFNKMKLVNYFIIAPIILIIEYIYWKKKASNLNPFYQFSPYQKHKLSQLPYIFLILIISIILTEVRFASSLSGGMFNTLSNQNSNPSDFGIFDTLFSLLKGKNLEEILNDLASNSSIFGMLRIISLTGMTKDYLIDFWMLLFMTMAGFRSWGTAIIFRRAYCSLFIHTKYYRPTNDLLGFQFTHKYTFTRIRELILPGWGHIYLERYWMGFPILFLFLLGLFFLITATAYKVSPSFGVSFLSMFGLKPGINEKEFIPLMGNYYTIGGLSFLILILYYFANSHITKVLKEDEPQSPKGLESGFLNNLHISILAHIILLAIILIVPISIQRESSTAKKREVSNFQPEKLEYYFIDPEIPDEVKELNGGVVSGTETPSQNEGENIPDSDPKDEGKVKGYVKRIKGKRLTKTYSNYISARMRGPESFMEYWKKAPFPYSSVVAYTITTDGDIVDIEIVEASNYPEQDALTIELIQSMSPVMPPPNVRGDVRVTELFWNGAIDPNAMPTPLQKDLVLQFDGRVMEEF